LGRFNFEDCAYGGENLEINFSFEWLESEDPWYVFPYALPYIEFFLILILYPSFYQDLVSGV